jgi:hypothetical protein
MSVILIHILFEINKGTKTVMIMIMMASTIAAIYVQILQRHITDIKMMIDVLSFETIIYAILS